MRFWLYSLWQPKCPLKRARKNGAKAIYESPVKERQKRDFIKKWRGFPSTNFYEKEPRVSRSSLPSIKHILSSKKNPVFFSYKTYSTQGISEKMEDFLFVIEHPLGLLAAVLDGHGGDQAAKTACNFFKENFFIYMKKFTCPVTAMQKLFAEASMLIKTPSGTTVLLCFLEKKTHAVFTATLGDSEAKIYRKHKKKWVEIPLSCVRDWSSFKDSKRAGLALTGKQQGRAKDLRVLGLNVSRAIGDCFIPQVSAKPKISLNKINKGDVLLLATDGLWDYVLKEEIMTRLECPKALSNYAIQTGKSPDNVSIVLINID